MNWVLVSLVGLAAGVVSGLFGVGGAVVIIPGLVLVVGLSQHTANGTSLAALLLPVGILGTLEYYKRGQVNIRYAAIIAGGLLLGRLGGAKRGGPGGAWRWRGRLGFFCCSCRRGSSSAKRSSRIPWRRRTAGTARGRAVPPGLRRP